MQVSEWNLRHKRVMPIEFNMHSDVPASRPGVQSEPLNQDHIIVASTRPMTRSTSPTLTMRLGREARMHDRK